MKRIVKVSLAKAVLGAALVFSATATAGISNTKHFLGFGGPGPNNVSIGDTSEICVFCHTPHGGDTGASVPLWNKVLSGAIYQTYDTLGTSTLDAGITAIGSVSLACLTCHDGTQALDNIINAPGSGGYNPGGGGPPGILYTWTSTDGSLNPDGAFIDSVDVIGGTNIFAIGTDLRNDHPVSVQYGGGGVSSTSIAGPTRDTDFTVPDYNGVGSDRWWIDNVTMEGSGSTANVLDKWDFKLYTRTDNSGGRFAGTPEPFVECGSCHDPHLETTTFLRIDPAVNGGASNNGSRVCLTCHTK